ncbi:hypothetical protein ACFL4X_02115 [Gemmatimonadota bacterium]
MSGPMNRRNFIGSSLLGAVAGMSLENQALLAQMEQPGDAQKLSPVTGLPKGKIGDIEISRLICGGNLFSGFAHSRDLIYVSSLLKNYFTPEKIMDTLESAEENGINSAILRCDEHIVGVLNRYRKDRGGKIQWIAQTYPSENDLTSNIKLAIDNGAVAAYPQGGIGDSMYKNGKFDLLLEAVAFIRKNGLQGGIGCHHISVIQEAEKQKVDCDFYFKTLNVHDYHSEPVNDVSAFFRNANKPWIAFKVLGAGMSKPGAGFKMAFSLGADFINVGMFDFQINEDAKIAKNILTRKMRRERVWQS